MSPSFKFKYQFLFNYIQYHNYIILSRVKGNVYIHIALSDMLRVLCQKLCPTQQPKKNIDGLSPS